MNFQSKSLFFSGNGHLEVVQELLKDKRVDPSAFNNFAISLACENGHLDVVNRLIELGANNFSTGLHYACYGGYLSTVDRMLELDNSPFSICEGFKGACCSGNLLLVKKLIKLEENYFTKSDFNEGLENAMNYGHMLIATEMLQLGAHFKYSFHSIQYWEWELIQESIKKIVSEFVNDDLSGIIVEYNHFDSKF